MENSNKKNGIFLGVISVATLIVAIIGATFAYFSAQTQSDSNAVNVKAYEFGAELTSFKRIYPDELNDSERATKALTEGIIPVLSTNLEKAINNTNKCIDENGHMVCALYEAEITNTGKALDLGVSIKSIENKKGPKGSNFTDLRFQGLTSSAENTYGIGPTEKVNISTEKDGVVSAGTLHIDEGTTEAPATVKHYFAIYLEEPEGGNTDQSSQMGATFVGQIFYASGEGTDKLTGTFTV